MSIAVRSLWKGYLLVLLTLTGMVLLFLSYYSYGLAGTDIIVISDKLNSFIGLFLIGEENSDAVLQVKEAPWYYFYEDQAIQWFAVVGLFFALVSLLWIVKLRKLHHLKPYCAFAASFSMICLVFGSLHLYRL